MDPIKVKEIYKAANAHNQIQHIHELENFVICNGQHTNILASIVPTKRNINEILDVSLQCVEVGFFPLIAELENSGKACEVYDEC